MAHPGLGCLLAAWVLALPASGSARTLVVGADAEYQTLAAAAAAAGPGDTIRLPVGTRFECAVLSAPDLVLEGSGPGTILTDRMCEDKALLVVRGANLTVRDLVLARARTAEQNGAGIRLEGQGLTLERVRFDDDQVGVLAAAAGPGRIRVVDCDFSRGGVPGEAAKSALMVGAVALLRVERSRFTGVRGGQVSSDAGRTELDGNRIEDGVEPANAFAVRVAGELEMRDNVIVLGPNPPSRDSAVLATGPGARLHDNRLENATGRPERLLLDWTRGATLDGNSVPPGDALVGSAGLFRHRTGDLVRGMVSDMKSVARTAVHAAKTAVGR